MALLNQNNNYIKVYPNGNYEIYASEEARNKVKNAPPIEEVEAKYLSILRALNDDLERQYYDSHNWDIEFSGWLSEYQKFMYDFQIKHGGNTYPLMEQYYTNVADCIPNIIESGSIILTRDTPEEMYTLAKQNKYWGDTEDV